MISRHLRDVVSRDRHGMETLSCGHVQPARHNGWGYRLSETRQRECDACQQEEFDRQGREIASFGGPRLL